MMQDGPLHPWRICKTTVHKPHKMTHAYFEICSISNESVLHGRVRSTEGMRHDPNDGKNDARFLYPCVALCLKKKKREREEDAQLLFPVQQCGLNTEQTYQRCCLLLEVHYYPTAYAAIQSVFPLAVTEGDPAFSARLCIH